MIVNDAVGGIKPLEEQLVFPAIITLLLLLKMEFVTVKLACAPQTLNLFVG